LIKKDHLWKIEIKTRFEGGQRDQVVPKKGNGLIKPRKKKKNEKSNESEGKEKITNQ